MDNAANASLKDIDAILGLNHMHLPITEGAIVVLCWLIIHMVVWSLEKGKLAKWMRTIVSAMTTNWTNFKDEGPSGGCEKCMK